LAEQLLDRDKGDINVAIVRPSAVQPSYREPVPGWVDVMHGPVAVAILSALGLLRVAEFDFASRPGLIPVDMVSSATIAAAWHVATNK
jgi:fatty acyl-CoA reductase